MKKEELDKAKIYDFKSGKQVADLPSKVTPKVSVVTKDPTGKKPTDIFPGKLEHYRNIDKQHVIPTKAVAKAEVLKTHANGQWNLEVKKNDTQNQNRSVSALQMSEKEMRSEVGTNREQDIRVDKKKKNVDTLAPKRVGAPGTVRVPQIHDNTRASGDAMKAELCKFSSSGQWSLSKAEGFKHTDTHAGHDIHVKEEGGKFAHQLHGHGQGLIHGSNSGPIFDSKEKAVAAAKVKINANIYKAENPDKKEDAELGEKIEALVEDHAEENKAAERKEGHKLLGKADTK